MIRDLRFQLAHPQEQHDHKQHDKRSEGNTSYAHQSDPSWRVLHETGRADHALAESLRWENFRWTGLGQKT
jgi:hypothetical protein